MNLSSLWAKRRILQIYLQTFYIKYSNIILSTFGKIEAGIFDKPQFLKLLRDANLVKMMKGSE